MTSTMAARGSLRAFLGNAKAALKTAIEKKDEITFVIGNESADLDSITSSLVYAYLKSNQPPSYRLHIPLLNIPQSDISLRPELLTLLPRANLSSEHLITLSDLPELDNTDGLKTHLPPQNTHWILVDHNALTGVLGKVYSSRVVGCIDHHADEGAVPHPSSDSDVKEPRIIETAGSCTSLVTNYFRETWDSLSNNSQSSCAANAQGDSVVEDSAQRSLWDAQVAQLALASVLVDTHCLEDENKTTEHDRAAVKLLEAKINLCGKTSVGFDRGSFFKELDAAKRDLDAVELDGVLRKDYKAWTEAGGELVVGISSVVKDLGWLREKAKKEGGGKDGAGALVEAAKQFARERGLDVFAIMTTFTTKDEGFARELMALGMGREGKAAVERFAKSSGGELELKDLDSADEGEVLVRVWRQGKVAASRKQVAPMIRKAMNEKTA